MKLIAISPNVLVNPEYICSIEQKEYRGVDVTYIYVWDKEYILGIPIEDFYKSLENAGEVKQYFAG